MIAATMRTSTMPSAPSTNSVSHSYLHMSDVFRLPSAWLRGSMDAFDFINWYILRYDVNFENDTEDAWRAFAHKLACTGSAADETTAPPLRLYAYRQDSLPRFCFENYAEAGYRDVAEAGLNAFSNLYTMGAVTGIDFPVQAVLITQLSIVKVLTDAWNDIRRRKLREYAFVCHGATHRSVACCMLLAAIAYPYAEICLTTRRTQAAAQVRNLL